MNHVTLNEALNSVSTCVIEAQYAGHVEEADLLQREVSLTIERRSSGQVRSFKGIVWHARVDGTLSSDQSRAYLQVTPAAALLSQRRDTRIFQDKTVVDVITEVYDEHLGSRGRSIQIDDLIRSYETREYIVQYQESYLQFITRLCEEEGIFFYFDHESDKETLILADSMGNLPQARPDDDGEVPYLVTAGEAPDGESAWDLHHRADVGSTDVVVNDFDWTNPSLDVRGEQTGRGEHEPALEVFDHTDALVFHSFNGTQYGGNTATVQAKLRAERLDLARQHWEMSSSVVTAKPGTTLFVAGHPDADLEQRYLIVACSGQGAATEGIQGSYENNLELVPIKMHYRPPRKTPRPLVHGPELATVVGPSGEEIHTDEHGRVRVHFAWDRYHDRTAEDSSCWMRVSHNWAGPGFGSFFLPRIGMEVLVNFLGGNPDRPLVTGCVYNGPNRSGVELPSKKTQTLIRTKSSPNSEGFNEMRFEDEAGNEFIYVHAEKDYNEEVEHNHSTHVKNCQSNTVDVNQTELVGGNQTMTVKKDRKKTIEENEVTHVQGDRSEVVDGEEDIVLKKSRKTAITKHENLEITQNRTVKVLGEEKQLVKSGREVIIKADDTLRVQEGGNRVTHVTGEYRIKSDGKYQQVQGDSEKFIQDSQKTYVESGKEIELKTGNSDYSLKNDGNVKLTAGSKVEIEVGGCKIEITTSKITLSAGASSIELGPSGVTTSGPKVSSSAQTMNEVTGLVVKIN